MFPSPEQAGPDSQPRPKRRTTEVVHVLIGTAGCVHWVGGFSNFKYTFSSIFKQAEYTQIHSQPKQKIFLCIAPCTCFEEIISDLLAN